MYKTRITIMALVAIVVAGCEQDPTGFDPDFVPSNSEAAEAVASVWDLLPESGAVEAALIDGLAASASADALGLVFEAGDLMAEANDAAREGDGPTAQTLTADAESTFLAAMVAGQGASVAEQVVSSVEAAVAALVDGGSDAPGVASSIADASSLAQDARSALASGNVPDALRNGLEASDRLRHLDPERRAREIVEHAVALLQRAIELAGPDPRPEIADLLREAQGHCDDAVRALGAHDWALAVREAQKCSTVARRVIVLLSGGIDDGRLEARAIALVEQATELYGRAVALAGDDPPELVARALEQAGDFLAAAEEALRDDDYREAIRLARESIAISHRVIGLLSDDRPSDRLEARAQAAVAHAVDLYERAVGLAGDPPRPEIQEELDEARALIDAAQDALEREEWSRALVKAKAAAAILIHVIRVLV